MRDELFDVARVIEHLPPDGEYKGTWSGYCVRFGCGEKEWSAKANKGIRGGL